MFQEEYQRIQERRELEDNYINFKAVLGSKSPTKAGAGNEPEDDQGEEFDESNPFFEEKPEGTGSNPFSSGDDDYDDEKNPFS